ncbi:hypothetical protein SAMN05421856_105262 [Chryseobacterium taichungense]|uniref:Uncharacterized protein n=1 Tax=Chryseobacterium taichungense TaxID=295069 RepID=A0A1H8ACE0_9FLAO|nr:hypothetical protein SAMN05421856_105262 [Chryseobacterium taichungense]
MIIIIQISHTLFFLAINYLIFINYNRKIRVMPFYIIFLLLYLSGLFYLNTQYNAISNKLLVVLLFFSLAIILLNIMKRFINIGNNKVFRENNNFKQNYIGLKNVIFEKIVPIMIFVYQILLIRFPVIFERMSNE